MTLHKKRQYLSDKHPILFNAIEYHRTHKNESISLASYPYLKQVYLDDAKELAVMKSTQCFVGGTIVYTSDGAKDIENVKEGDLVLTHKGRYRKVISSMSTIKKGLISVRGDCNNSVISTNDHMYYGAKYSRGKYHYKRFDELNPQWHVIGEMDIGDYVSFPVVNQFINKGSINIKDTNEEWIRSKNQQSTTINKIPLNGEIGRLIGYFCAEGWTRIKGTEIGFGFHIKEKEYVYDVVNIISKLTTAGIHVKDEKNHNCTRIVLRDRTLHDFFSKEIRQGSHNKKIPDWIFKASEECIKGFIIGSFRGDGYIKKNQMTYTSASTELINGMKQLLCVVGVYSRIKYSNKGHKLIINGINSIRLSNILGVKNGSKYSRIIKKDGVYLSRIKEMNTIEGAHRVYDIEVEEDHSFIANGYVVHNCGLSEYLSVRAITHSIKGLSVFYVFPTHEVKNRFVKNRIEKTLSNTAYYKAIMSVRAKKEAESVSLKHIGKGSIAFVGSNTPNAFTEYPADEVIIDEYDRCSQENIPMAWERLSASTFRRVVSISNPTINSYGIDLVWKRSDMKKWYIKCHKCGKWVNPDFFKHVVQEVEPKKYVIIDEDYDELSGRDIRMICECGATLGRNSDGEWVKTADGDVSGYHISKMFSTEVTMREIVERFQNGLVDDTKLQRFFNGDIGIPYTATGSQIQFDDLDACKRDYTMPDKTNTPCVMGIDVGAVLHIVIGELMADGLARVVFIGTANDYADVKELYRRYNVRAGVVDALPETRLSRKITGTLKGMFACYYGNTKIDTVNVKDLIITVQRTPALDGVKEAFLSQTILLPKNADKLSPVDKNGFSEYYNHINSSTRIFNEERNDYQWTEADKADHYLHATCYMTLARKIAMKM